MIRAAEFTHLLADRFFRAGHAGARDVALGELLDCIASASAEIVELFEYGHGADEFERVVRKRLGPASLAQIDQVVAAIRKPISEDDVSRSKASPIKSSAAGDTVKEDEIYYTVMMPAHSLFVNLRDAPRNIMTGRDIRSGTVLNAREQLAIKRLVPLPGGRRDWAKLIVKLTLSGRYWAKLTELQVGGAIYAVLADRAVRNRRGKSMKAFKKRYGRKRDEVVRGISPREFLDLQLSDKAEVIDQSKRAGGEPLDGGKVSSVTEHAEKIEAMVPTWRELKRELLVVVTDRLSTVPRM